MVEGARAELGDPIELDLEGRGIRGIELAGTTYLVLAGPPGDVGSFAELEGFDKKTKAKLSRTLTLTTISPGTALANAVHYDGGKCGRAWRGDRQY